MKAAPWSSGYFPKTPSSDLTQTRAPCPRPQRSAETSLSLAVPLILARRRPLSMVLTLQPLGRQPEALELALANGMEGWVITKVNAKAFLEVLSVPILS